MGNQQSQGSQSDQVLDNDDSVRRNSTAFRRNSDFSKKANTACLERLFQVMHLKRCLCKQIPVQLSGVIIHVSSEELYPELLIEGVFSFLMQRKWVKRLQSQTNASRNTPTETRIDTS